MFDKTEFLVITFTKDNRIKSIRKDKIFLNKLNREELLRLFDYVSYNILRDVDKENIEKCGERLKQMIDLRTKDVRRQS